MQVIPVIDLKDGVVVHAREGRRDTYRPIHSTLCPSADIVDVIGAYLNVHDFQTFYIADLNALAQRGDHQNLIDSVAERFTERTFWVDSGLHDPLPNGKQPVNIKAVLGSESFREDSLMLLESCPQDFILSLDFAGTTHLGAESLFTNPDYWPNTIIIMTLDRVGSDSGPDEEKLAAFCSNHPGKTIIAAGGIRNKDDLLRLKKIGIRQALVASALHSGAIGRAELAML